MSAMSELAIDLGLTYPETDVRYVCKVCGAESPAGIGYAVSMVGPLPAPAVTCHELHRAPVLLNGQLAHRVGVIADHGARYPWRAVCVCRWQSWGYAAEHAAVTMAADHLRDVAR